MQPEHAQFSKFTPKASHPKPLIDVLAKFDEEEDDWSINRNLWSGYQEKTPEHSDSDKVPVPVLSEQVPPKPFATKEQGQRSTLPDSPRHKTVFQAMLEALELTLNDLSPENLEQQFNQASATSSESDTLFSNSAGTPNYWEQYQNFYQHLMNEQHYRLLFLHKLRDAMRQQP